MKKFFAFVAAALIAFSFSSCEKGASGSSFFKVKVSNITSTTVDISIEPADTLAYYFANVLESATVAKYTVDTIAATYAANIDAYLKKGATGEALVQYGYLIQGKVAGTIPGLPANTDLTLVVFKVVIDGTTAKHGDISYVNFKTKDVEIKGEVDLGALQGGGFEDYRELDGSYIAYAADNATYDVTLNIIDNDFEGNYTEADLMAADSYIWTKDMNSEKKGLSISKAELKNVPGNDNVANVSGWVIASNDIKYKFSFTYPTVEAAGAPKKVAAKKATNELKLGSLKFMRFSK